jgi:replicative DNA helicase
LAPPHSTPAELAIIGSIFANPGKIHSFADRLKPRYFYSSRHQVLVEAIVELATEGVAPDVVNVFERLRFNHGDRVAESAEHLMGFLDFSTYSENVFVYLDEVKKYWELRELILKCDEIAERGRGIKGASVSAFLADVEKTFLEISESRLVQGLVPATDVVSETIQSLEHILANPHQGVTGVGTGFGDLDHITAGFQRSDLIILAARPAMGKTALVLNFATHAALVEKKQVAFFSLEMSKQQLMQRILATGAKIKSQKFRDGSLTQTELDRLYPKAAHLQTDKLMIDDTPSISLFELSSRCRKMKREKGACDLVIIDYLQLMSAGESFSAKATREREISTISMGLKALAKELNCPVLSCAQLNRGLEMRPDKRPRPSDLRESGSIEQDADLIFFIYRDEVYNKDTLEKGVAELIIGKNRHGPIDTIKLAFLSDFTSFHNLAKNNPFL